MNTVTSIARTLNTRTEALAQRATALGFAALVTLSMLGGVDALATAPLHDSPTMAQQAEPTPRG
jgi:hypothetical protein